MSDVTIRFLAHQSFQLYCYFTIERRVHGVAYYSISQTDLVVIMIPIITIEQQKNIVCKTIHFFALEKQSKQLLEIAKTEVEKAIEENEDVAKDWIKQQLKMLGVEFV